MAANPYGVIDHVLLPVDDLEAGARRLLERFGLASAPGGWHPGLGTANRIVPLGSTYLELIAVVDPEQAAANPRARRIAAAVAAGSTFLTWALRTTDIDALRRRLLAAGWGAGELADGTRERPDGATLRWRSAELYPTRETDDPGLLPFLIEWAPGLGAHPGQMQLAHRARAGDVSALRFRDPEPEASAARLATLLGDQAEVVVTAGAAPRLVAIELEAPAGRLVIS